MTDTCDTLQFDRASEQSQLIISTRCLGLPSHSHSVSPHLTSPQPPVGHSTPRHVLRKSSNLRNRSSSPVRLWDNRDRRGNVWKRRCWRSSGGGHLLSVPPRRESGRSLMRDLDRGLQVGKRSREDPGGKIERSTDLDLDLSLGFHLKKGRDQTPRPRSGSRLDLEGGTTGRTGHRRPTLMTRTKVRLA